VRYVPDGSLCTALSRGNICSADASNGIVSNSPYTPLAIMTGISNRIRSGIRNCPRCRCRLATFAAMRILCSRTFSHSLGQSRRFDPLTTTFGLPQSTDIVRPAWLVRFVPEADIARSLGQVRKVPCVDGSVLARAFFTFCSIGRCSHVFGLLMRFT